MAMSEMLPDEIIKGIVIRLPVKSVSQFRCVSKQWYSFISDPKFMGAHFSFHEQQVKLIHISEVSYSLHTLTLNPNPQNGIDAISTKVNFQEKWWRIVGSCNGLVLVSNDKYVLFLMNPTTLEYRKIPKSHLALTRCRTCMSYLGYDYKVITLSGYYDLSCTFVDVYSVRTGFWRRLETISHTISIHSCGVFLNGALHWYTSPSAIVAFDLSDEKFFEVPMPTNTTLDDDDSVHFYDFGGCLCMLVCRTNENEFDVWMMKEYGVAESWTKFSVKSNTCPYGFTPVRRV